MKQGPAERIAGLFCFRLRFDGDAAAETLGNPISITFNLFLYISLVLTA